MRTTRSTRIIGIPPFIRDQKAVIDKELARVECKKKKLMITVTQSYTESA